MVSFIVKYWSETILIAITGYFVKQVKKQKALQNGVQALLRDRLLHSYEYAMTAGFMTIYQKQSWLSMYEEYKTLNGNSFVDTLVDEVEDIEIKTR